MIEQSNTRVEPAGYLDQYGNFERIAQDWMEEEPGTVWRPVFYEFQQTAAPVTQPLTDERAAEMLGFVKGGLPLDEFSQYNRDRIRLVQKGWNAAHGIGQGGAKRTAA